MRTVFSRISDAARGKVRGSGWVQPYRQDEFGRLEVPG
jgi:hypothetical protein